MVRLLATAIQCEIRSSSSLLCHWYFGVACEHSVTRHDVLRLRFRRIPQRRTYSNSLKQDVVKLSSRGSDQTCVAVALACKLNLQCRQSSPSPQSCMPHAAKILLKTPPACLAQCCISWFDKFTTEGAEIRLPLRVFQHSRW